MIYISALTEADAVMGNDGKFIRDVAKAAGELSPKFIAICGSPMPAMTGFDYSSAADEIERETGLTTFFVDTNGTHSYLQGAEGAFLNIAKLFCCEGKEKQANSVNIIGATPLDFSVNTSVARHGWRRWSYSQKRHGRRSFPQAHKVPSILPKYPPHIWISLLHS